MIRCLYEPIHGDYPTVSFCSEYPASCEGCPYRYEDPEEEAGDGQDGA